MSQTISLGATCIGEGRCQFCVWAPQAQKVEVHLLAPLERLLPLQQRERGYHQATVEGVEPGNIYRYRLDDAKELPDPASRFQPQGVHGPSQVLESSFSWEDCGWPGLPLRDYIIYELHVGTFTSEGTFEAIIPHLDGLKELGITAVEVMPVAQFPGSRNWGYDGVYPFAVQNSYGGPRSLKRLVSACHQKGLAILLDVVYNHLGPEGNYLAEFGPYFTERYRTPWGPAINYDGAYSDEVRRYFVENALYWVTEFHIDALRLDAVHAIMDHSAQPFLQELATAVHGQAEQLNRWVYLIAESTLNDTRLIRPIESGGYGLDAQWNDEFHHSLHVLLTRERHGYYQDFGRLDHLVKALREGFVYSGEFSPYRGHRHGISSGRIPADRFVVFGQNHDVVGNRKGGERLSQLISFEGLKLVAGLVILSPYIPLFFMGEEYGEVAPFHYFISHLDQRLVEAVRRGRREEFATFQWQDEPPDPQDESIFLHSKLNHHLHREGHHRILLELYKELLRLRREVPALRHICKERLEVGSHEKEQVLFLHRWKDNSDVFAVFSLSDSPATVVLPLPEGRWRKQLDSADRQWNGGGSSSPDMVSSQGETKLMLSPKSFLLLIEENQS
jgi:maltooligosyltrehalose trehalohydrolase